jgi:hypothetical protein
VHPIAFFFGVLGLILISFLFVPRLADAALTTAVVYDVACQVLNPGVTENWECV